MLLVSSVIALTQGQSGFDYVTLAVIPLSNSSSHTIMVATVKFSMSFFSLSAFVSINTLVARVLFSFLKLSSNRLGNKLDSRVTPFGLLHRVLMSLIVDVAN